MNRTAIVVGALLFSSACKEKGTITIDLDQYSCGASRVRFQAIKNGTCSCTCDSCTCPTTSTQDCILDVPCSGSGYCPIEEARATGIEFDPPSPGRYALTYQFLDDAVAAKTLSVACVIVEVDADGTTSSTTMPMPAPTCCM